MGSTSCNTDARSAALAALAAPAPSHERELMVGGASQTSSRGCGDSSEALAMGSYTKLTYHVVFSTKYRQRTLTEQIRERLYQYMGGVLRNLKGSQLEIGGIEDHVHLLLDLSPTRAVSDTIRDIKANASKWVNDLSDVSSRFEWQKGYAAFTVSHSQVETIRAYIRNQREHHRRLSFEEEYIKILERHEIPFERKTLFEAEHLG